MVSVLFSKPLETENIRIKCLNMHDAACCITPLIYSFFLLLFVHEKKGRGEEIFPISSSRGCCRKMIISSCYAADNCRAAQEEQSISITELKNTAVPKASSHLG